MFTSNSGVEGDESKDLLAKAPGPVKRRRGVDCTSDPA